MNIWKKWKEEAESDPDSVNKPVTRDEYKEAVGFFKKWVNILNPFKRGK